MTGFRVGDDGQRYEISVRNKETGEVHDLGWSESPDGFKEFVEVHPNYKRSCWERIVHDRQGPNS